MKSFPVKNFIFETGTIKSGLQELPVRNFIVLVHVESFGGESRERRKISRISPSANKRL